MSILLTRNQFRESVFERDGNKCVLCEKPAVDAHHVLERRLWPDGGYYLNNGVSLCEEHHLACERTLVSPEQAREAAGITEVSLPPHLYRDETYDKWGNNVLANGLRTRGELFFDPSVQKVLGEGGVLNIFTHLVKYPRTYHLPWSPGMTDDDRMMSDLSSLESEKEIIVSAKLDGENTTLFNCALNPAIHARSINGYEPHESRSWTKAFHAMICQDIPMFWRVCGENVYAKHSIHYKGLKTYAYGFSIWNDKNEILSWDETLDWFNLLGIEPVPVLYRGPWDENLLRNLWKSEINGNLCEGYVVRSSGLIRHFEFRSKVGKFVRKNHVQTNKHWLRGQPVIPNELLPGLTGFEKVSARY
jgi:hypothetical protein